MIGILKDGIILSSLDKNFEIFKLILSGLDFFRQKAILKVNDIFK